MTDAVRTDAAPDLVQLTEQRGVGQKLHAVVYRRGAGELDGGGLEDVQQRARRRCRAARIYGDRMPERALFCPRGMRNYRLHIHLSPRKGEPGHFRSRATFFWNNDGKQASIW